MNKAELIAKLADDAGLTKTQANATLDSFVEAVTKTLKGGGKVTLVGFGTFSVSKRAARNGRNPQTGAVIKIKAKKLHVSKPGKNCQPNYDVDALHPKVPLLAPIEVTELFFIFATQKE